MTDGDSEERLVAEVPEELKTLVDADRRTNKEAVIAALWREYGGQRKGALERRIEEKRARIEVIKEEIAHRESELEQEREELRRLEEKLDARHESEDAYDEDLAEIAEEFAESRRVLPSFRSEVQDICEEYGKETDDVVADIREYVDEQGYEIDGDRWTDSYGDGL